MFELSLEDRINTASLRPLLLFTRARWCRDKTPISTQPPCSHFSLWIITLMFLWEETYFDMKWPLALVQQQGFLGKHRSSILNTRLARQIYLSLCEVNIDILLSSASHLHLPINTVGKRGKQWESEGWRATHSHSFTCWLRLEEQTDQHQPAWISSGGNSLSNHRRGPRIQGTSSVMESCDAVLKSAFFTRKLNKPK